MQIEIELEKPTPEIKIGSKDPFNIIIKRKRPQWNGNTMTCQSCAYCGPAFVFFDDHRPQCPKCFSTYVSNDKAGDETPR